MAAIGIKNPEQSGSTRTLNVKIEAAKDLNAGEDGKGLPTVARIYKLKAINAFLVAPYVYFSTPDLEKRTFGGEVIEVKEVTLLPGKITEIEEKMPGDAPYLGVVVLFRTPYANRWRLVFPTGAPKGEAIRIGAHTCALTATTLAPVGTTLSESSLLSASRCQ
ncbi:hypothetical protein GCM10027343_42710 [Noviherbaspirillum agri]